MLQIEVPFNQVKQFIQAGFRGAKSRRTVKIRAQKSYHVADYWDGGSRDECVFVELGTMRVMSSSEIPNEVRQQAANPFSLPIADVLMQDNFAVIEHCIFCGKDLGYRIYVSPGRLDKMNTFNVMNELTSPSKVMPALEENNNVDKLLTE